MYTTTKKLSAVIVAVVSLILLGGMFMIQPALATAEEEQLETISTQIGLIRNVVAVLGSARSISYPLVAATSAGINTQISLQEMTTLSEKVKQDNVMLTALTAQREDVLTQMTGLVTQITNDQALIVELNNLMENLPVDTSMRLAAATDLKSKLTTLETKIRQATIVLTSVAELREGIYTQMSELRKDITMNQSRITLLNKGVEVLIEIPVFRVTTTPETTTTVKTKTLIEDDVLKETTSSTTPAKTKTTPSTVTSTTATTSSSTSPVSSNPGRVTPDPKKQVTAQQMTLLAEAIKLSTTVLTSHANQRVILNTQTTDLVTRISTYQATLDQLNKEMQNLPTAESARVVGVAELKTRMNVLAEAIKLSTTVLTSLANQRETVNTQITDLVTRISEYQAQIDQFNQGM